MEQNATKCYKAGMNSIITLTITGKTNEKRDGVVDAKYAKFRTSSARVDDIEDYKTKEKMVSDMSIHDISFIYTLGEEVKVENYDEDINGICAPGIHYFKTREAAESWYIPNDYLVDLEGLYREWHENGELQKECTYRAGKLEGVYRELHDNGIVSLECTYKNGRLDGSYIEFYRNGRPELKRTYKNGLRI
jgi:antitoxin component YwqK of YwqJK toxin-antitoxin module